MEKFPNYYIKYTLFLIFALSGFSGLIYESIWTHYIKLLLGHAAYAQTLVLSIFMGGMAIGASLTAIRSKPIKHPLKAYALIELVIGVLALMFHEFFIFIESFLHETLIPSIDSPALIELMRWLIAGLLILPQSIFLGATFPLIAIAVVRLDKRHSGSTLGMLYFTNSIGAAIGVLVSAFVLINAVGLPGTILTAGILNIFIAIIVWYLSKSEVDYEGIEYALPTKDIEPAMKSSVGKNSIIRPELFLLVAFFTGLASFFYEIGWIRMLSQVLGSSMQAFELMLSAFITGIALGGLWIRKRIENIKNTIVFLAKVQVIMGLLAMLTLPMYHEMFNFMGFLVNSLDKNEGGYLIFNLGSHIIAMLIMLPATFMAGMTLPLITYSLLKLNQGEGSIGNIYAANTVGAIVGILAAIHIIMPMYGTKVVIIIGAAIDISLGVYLYFKFSPFNTASRRYATVISVLIVFIFMINISQFDPKIMSSGVFRNGKTSQPEDTNMLYYQDGKTASIAVYQTYEGVKVITTNGKPDAGISPIDQRPTGDEITMLGLAVFPMAIHPQATTLANIGMGSGLTSHLLLSYPQIKTLDTIEIEPAVVDALVEFGEITENALNDPRSKIIIDDAKAFFSRNKKKYDVIISEPSNPWVSGVAGLFSDEFYHNINRYLKKDGVLVQWLQLYETNIHLLTSVVKALGDNFKDYAIYSTGDTDIVIVAANGRSVTQFDPHVLDNMGLKETFERVHINSIEDLSTRLIGTKSILAPYFNQSTVPKNSDYFPYLSLNSPKARYLKQSATELTSLHLVPFPPAQLLKPIVNKMASGNDYPPNIQKQVAQEVANILAGIKPKYQKSRLPEQIKLRATYIKSFIDSCGSTNTDRDESFLKKNVFELAQTTFAAIESTSIKDFWGSFSANIKICNLDKEMNKWAGFYSSITVKNHLETIKLAKELVKPSELTINEFNFIVAASIDAYIKLQKYQEGVKFFRQISNAIKYNQTLPLYIEIMLAYMQYHAKLPDAN